MRQHLEAAKRSGAIVPELDLPPPPPELHFVLPVYYELAARRPYEQGVPLPITHMEIWAYCQLTRTRLREWELEAVKLLDRLWLTAMRKASAGPA
jgi:hypothetical protein